MSTSLDFERERKSQLIFEEAIELPEQQQIEYIDQQCGDDAELAKNIKRLLQNQHSNSGFFDLWYGDWSESDTDIKGHIIDCYELVKKLGSGGMADVYLAKRTDGVHDAPIALKIIRPSSNLQKLVGRFHTERKILANLKHPNIAQLLDGGSTPSGAPYFVMEYVEGQRLDEYCEKNHLSINERLCLFKKICSAVSYAHQNLIIHRDIKPSNIIVDNKGEPKLLDFGLAKLIDQSEEQNKTVTELILTPNYASPEQIKGGVLTTASDCYSLGILLYELLVGKRPFESRFRFPVSRPQGGSDIPLPSKALADSKESPEIKKQCHILRGDLDTIVLKLLRDEPERRYVSVQSLIDDIDRYLTDRPVLARKDTFRYRTTCFIKRNLKLLSVVGIAAIVLVVNIVLQQARVLNERDLAEYERDNAIRERNKSKMTEQFMVNLFDISDPSESRGNSITAREILDRAVNNINKERSLERETKSDLLNSMGVVYRELGLYKAALPLLQQALDIRRDINTEELKIAESLSELGTLYELLWKYKESEAKHRAALNLYLNNLNKTDNQTADSRVADSYNALGIALRGTSQYDESLLMIEKALSIKLTIYGENHASTAFTYYSLGAIYDSKGSFEKSAEYYKKSLAIRIDVLGADHPKVGESHRALGTAYRKIEKYDLAIEQFEKSLPILTKTLGEEHPKVASIYNDMGALYGYKTDFEESINVHLKALEIRLKVLGNEHPNVARSYYNIGAGYEALGNPNTAIDYFNTALSIATAALGEGHPGVSYPHYGLGLAFHQKGNLKQALKHSEKSYSIRLATWGEGHPVTKDAANLISTIKEMMNEK